MLSTRAERDAPAEADDVATLTFEAEPRAVAWEQVDVGRYQPRRICGSNPGRELG